MHNNHTEWYLAASKPKQEMRAIENLENQGIKAFTPLIKVEKIRAGKRKIVEEAMFSGYVFINVAPTDGLWHKVKSTRGIRDWVKLAGSAAKVPAELVNSLIEGVAKAQQAKVLSCFKPGDSVVILDGPFKGLNGIFEMPDGEQRSMVLIDFLGKQNRVPVPNEQILIN
ncbi:transcription/translation regulatory transformer protein RfaH [Aliikangiella sp. IMCC44632]